VGVPGMMTDLTYVCSSNGLTPGNRTTGRGLPGAARCYRPVAPGPDGYDALPAPGLTAVTVKIDLAVFAQV
jgi:hypothetical protein